jgi:rhamnose utilization protein RhaD (predicted bifunctional aldolase and dehydrogenase)/NAD(P)-dependent dehydrogenase (short-subunit alcohol dehydrogenase family)
MQSRYEDADVGPFLKRLGAGVPELLGLRTYTARLLGADGALVLHGGGNTSVKGKARTLAHGEVDVLYVKGSGWDLATIEPPGHPAVRLAPLLALRALPALSDEAMVNELRTNLLDASAPTPSVETLLHAFLPARFIDHTHADGILAVADQPDGEAVCRSIFRDGLVWVPYVMPGFALAKACADAYDAHVKAGKRPEVIVLERHGIFTFGETAKESYGRMIAAVSRAEGFVAEARHTVALSGDPAASPYPADAVTQALRGAVARLSGAPTERGPMVHLRAGESILKFLARPDAAALASVGCATPDHVLRTKPWPLFLALPAPARPGDTEALAQALRGAVEAQLRTYAARYDAYFAEKCAERNVTRTKLDPWPRVVLAPGVGILTLGTTLGEATIAADVYEHTIDVIEGAADVGTYAPVGLSDLFDVEYWSLEQAKLKKTAPRPLAQAVALVTGAASGIGRTTAARLHAEGAHVVLVDLVAERLEAVAASFGKDGASRVTCAVADVTNVAAVERAFAHATRTFGGVDVVVSNAGNAPMGDLHTPEGDRQLRDSLELNLLAHNHVASAAMRVFLAQGNGGCLLFNVSKAAVTPGPHFGPYAVAKAALLALVRQYAVDAAVYGVRANAVNADRIRTGLFGDGVAEARAAARGLTIEAYFKSNLLGREVTETDVADAFVYLAGARATTGGVVTVDGGNPAAFPR